MCVWVANIREVIYIALLHECSAAISTRTVTTAMHGTGCERAPAPAHSESVLHVGKSDSGPDARRQSGVDPHSGSGAVGPVGPVPPFVEGKFTFDTVYGDAAGAATTTPHTDTPPPLVPYQPMRRLGSIHGKTSEVAETQMQSKKWDWNTLPSAHKEKSPLDTERRSSNSTIGQAPPCNIAQVSIDGEVKAIRYDPAYNRRLAQMDLFLRFNTETTQRDSLVNAKRRLKSYVKYCSRSGGVAASTGGNDPYDTQAREIVQLWSYQVETYFSQTNSLLFSADVAQTLINRRTQRRKSTPSSGDDQGLGMTPVGDAEQSLSGHTLASSRPSHSMSYLFPETSLLDPLEEIDVLLLRPLVTQEIGWQLAFNEPQITVADYELNIGPWKEADEKSNNDLLKFMESGASQYKYNEGAIVETELARLKQIDSVNAPRYLLDIMNRRLADYAAGHTTPVRGRPRNLTTTVDDINSLTRSEHSLDFQRDTSDALSIKSYAAPSVVHAKKKKKESKKSGFVNFFRRKHTSSVPPPPAATAAAPPPSESTTVIDDRLSINSNTPDIPSPRFLPTPPSFAYEKSLINPQTFESIDNSIIKNSSSNNLNEHGHGHEPQNVWLENHYCEILSNYRKVDMPTQYYFPRNKATGLTPEVSPNSQEELRGDLSQEALMNDSSQESFNSNERIKHHVSTNIGNYGRELLQLKLPFKDDSVPAVLCPWIWTTLTRTKWGNLLREIKRCLQPGGYILAIATDLRISNSEYPVPEADGAKFKTSIERNALFDTMAIDAMNRGLHLFPTKHLAKKFKECGFTDIKTTTLSLKSGDLKSNMGCINEFMIALLWHLITGSRVARGAADDGLEVDGLVERFIKEHWDKVDNNAGCLRTTFIVAQKPRTMT